MSLIPSPLPTGTTADHNRLRNRDAPDAHRLLQSGNFVDGVSGWEIAEDGSAQFNDVTVRGLFQTASSGKRVEISSTTFDRIEFYTGDANEEDNGFIRVSVAPPNDTPTLTIFPPEFRVTGQDTFLVLKGRAPSIGDGAVELTSPKITLWATGGSDPHVNIDGEMRIGAGKITQEAWNAPTFENSWTNDPGGYDAGYMMDSQGRVHLRGRITGGVANTVAFTLPAAYRPSATTRQVCHGVSSTAGHTGMLVIINASTGGVNINTVFEGGTLDWGSLDGISFDTQ